MFRPGIPAAECSPELDLLLATARFELRPSDRLRASTAIARGVDWSAALAAARHHRVLPLLHRHVATGAIEAPAAFRPALDEAAATVARRALQFASELLNLLSRFEKQGIPVLPLKGPILSDLVYGSIALRDITDIDLLFRWEDLPAACRILSERGYVIPPWNYPSTATHSAYHEIAAFDARRGLKVDMHYALLSPRGRTVWTLDALTPRLQTRRFSGADVPYLSPADLLVYLCEHGAAHAWHRLGWLAVSTELMMSERVDEASLKVSMSYFDAHRRVEAAQLLARDLLGCATRPVNDLAAGLAAGLVVRNLRSAHSPEASPALWRTFVYETLTDAGFLQRVHRFWATFFRATPHDARGSAWARSPLGLMALRLRGLTARAWRSRRNRVQSRLLNGRPPKT